MITEESSATILERLGACHEAVKWCGNKSPREAWKTCERGDWMLWLAAKIGVERKLIAKVACVCARQVLKFVPDGEDRSRVAIETTEAWCRGEATIEQVRIAACAADVAYAADAAANAAACAADVAYAANAAAYAADAARNGSLKRSAELVRETISFDVIGERLEKMK